MIDLETLNCILFAFLFIGLCTILIQQIELNKKDKIIEKYKLLTELYEKYEENTL